MNHLDSETKAAIRELLSDYGLGDMIYDVRERVDLSELKDGQSSWDHPEVVRFNEICEILHKAIS